MIAEIGKEYLKVATGDEFVKLYEVQFPGKTYEGSGLFAGKCNGRRGCFRNLSRKGRMEIELFWRIYFED